MIKVLKISDQVVRVDTISGAGLNTLYKVLEPKIEGIAFRTHITGFDKDDIRQELRVLIWTATKAYRASKGKYLTWILGCIDNKVKSLISQSQRDKDICLVTNNELRALTNIPENKENPLNINAFLSFSRQSIPSTDYKVLHDRIYKFITITSIRNQHYKLLSYETVRQRIRTICSNALSLYLKHK